MSLIAILTQSLSHRNLCLNLICVNVTIVNRKIHLYLRVYNRLRPVYAFAGQWLIIFWVFFDAIMLQFTTPGSYCVVICRLGCSLFGVLKGVSLHAPLCCFATNVFWSVAARTPSSIRYSSFAMPFIFSIFGISRQTDIHICDCSCDVIDFFWVLLDSGWFWFAISGTFARIYSATYAQLIQKCVRLRFARTHFSRSEVLSCLQLSYCFATIHR